MDEHLSTGRPGRLVLRLVEHELDRADDSGLILGHKQWRLPAATPGGDVAPERLRLAGASGQEADPRRFSMQSISTSASASICASSTDCSRRITVCGACSRHPPCCRVPILLDR